MICPTVHAAIGHQHPAPCIVEGVWKRYTIWNNHTENPH